MKGTPLRLRALAALTLLCVGLACAHLPPPPPARLGGYRYVDTQLGVAVELPAAWRGFERREDLPENLRDFLPSGFGPKPPMVALRQGDLAFGRVMYEPVLGLSTLEYLQVLLEVTRGKLDVLGAAYSSERDAARWRFRVKIGTSELTFVETIAVRRRHAIRVAFWSPSPLASFYADEFEAIASDVMLYEGSDWSAPWRDLEPSLNPGSFPSLEVALPSEPDSAPECERPPRGFLWKVPTARGAMFLFPALHVGHPDLYPLPPAVESAFAQSQRLVVEVDVRGAKAEEALTGRGGGSSAGASSAELPPAERAEVERRFAAFGLPAKSVERMPQWLLAAVLEFLMWQAQGYYAEFGVDRYFLDRAGEREVIELESADAQMALFQRSSGQLLEHTLRSLDELASRARPTIASWYCGGPAEFQRLATEGAATPMPAELQEAVLDQRNVAMAARLEPLLEAPGVTFVTVGLAHFFGPHGLPALLAARGHVVEGP